MWTGQQALKLKLVDKLGTLKDAIAEAAKLSKTKEYGVDCYPAPLTWLEQLQQTSVGGHYLEGRLRTALGTYYAPLHFINQIGNRPSLQAHRPAAANATAAPALPRATASPLTPDPTMPKNSSAMPKSLPAASPADATTVQRTETASPRLTTASRDAPRCIRRHAPFRKIQSD